MSKINVSIKSVSKDIYSGTADIVIMKAIDGDIAVMANHIPMVTILIQGQIKIKSDMQEIFFDIKNGMAKISDNSLTILNFN